MTRFCELQTRSPPFSLQNVVKTSKGGVRNFMGFWTSFGSHLGAILAHLAPLWHPMGPQGRFCGLLFGTLFSMPFFLGFQVSPGTPKSDAAVSRLHLWGVGKSTISEEKR